ncbi:MAG: hypothetical protein KAG99_00830, partial [Bacteroidales bacterium]|nr:hypothetical protein [Bacteroidales bacterium]
CDPGFIEININLVRGDEDEKREEKRKAKREKREAKGYPNDDIRIYVRYSRMCYTLKIEN